MTVSATTNRVTFSGPYTVPLDFTLKCYEDSDLVLVVSNNTTGAETALVLDTHYTVVIDDPGPGGTITMLSATYLPAGSTLTVLVTLPYTQEIDLEAGGNMPAEVLEEGFDRSTVLIQQLKEQLARSLKLKKTSAYSELTLPDPVAGKYLGWNSGLTGLDNFTAIDPGSLTLSPLGEDLIAATDASTMQDLLEISAFVKTLLNDATAGDFQTTLGISAFVKTILNDADAATVLATLGLDADLATLSLPASTTISAFIKTLLDDASAIAALTTLGIGNSFPQGHLVNGKIVVTDAAGLTVAIKTLAGTDPSATDPVYVRIGDTVRTISAALSVAKADGTNWGNAGSAELATKEVDWFVYLGYNATDGVVVGFSRFPGATCYSDFSATTTNEKYCAISTITTAAATDYYEVIGRFAATLSAGAGYTWTVPTFTAINLIQRFIHETRWLSFTPVSTGFSAAPTYSASYKIRGNQIFIKYKATAVGTSDQTYYTVSAPFAQKNNSLLQCVRGLASDNTGGLASAAAVTRNNSDPAVGKIIDLYYGDTLSATSWTNSGTKYFYSLDIDYEI